MLRKSFLTQRLTPGDLNTVAEAMYAKTYNEGDIIIKYGKGIILTMV